MPDTASKPLPVPPQYLSGSTFGRWTVLSNYDYRKCGQRMRRFWECLCTCGTKQWVAEFNLKSGQSTSCGCYRTERIVAAVRTHGGASHGNEHRLYSTWVAMRQRCGNPSNPAWEYYGGNGITVDPRWNDFALFLEDMEPSFQEGLTLDRISYKKGYSKDNCHWGTDLEQARNKSSNVYFELDGVRKTITNWSKDLGGAHPLVWARLKKGWSLREALTTPVDTSKQHNLKRMLVSTPSKG